MGDKGRALGEGLYWYAEKLRWGNGDVGRNPGEALRLYRQAANLGISDAHVRIGEFFEEGYVVDEEPAVALKCYKRAYEAGNPYGHTAVAKLLARSDHYSRAERHWAAAFSLLDKGVEKEFVADEPGAVVYAYIGAQLKHELPIEHLHFIRRNRQGVLAHHIRLLNHAMTDDRLAKLQRVQDWLAENLMD
jgi:TPR repeat protein